MDWIIPISLGDSHRGYRVVGTDRGYFEHLRYRDERTLQFSSGVPFNDLFDAVIGSTVARQLGYAVGDSILINHGLGSEALAEHGDRPFVVAGILEPTGTPVDRSVHVSLPAIEALHVDIVTPTDGQTTADAIRSMNLTPSTVSAAFVGLRTPLDTFGMQRIISQYPDEPLTAVLPGFGLLELWSVLEIAETALRAVSIMVVVVAVMGMASTLVAMLSQRRREMAILRSVGAGPAQVSLLLLFESLLLALGGSALGLGLTFVGLLALQPWIERAYGLFLTFGGLGWRELGLLVLVILAALIAGLIPAWRAFRQSVADGISPLE